MYSLQFEDMSSLLLTFYSDGNDDIQDTTRAKWNAINFKFLTFKISKNVVVRYSILHRLFCDDDTHVLSYRHDIDTRSKVPR